MEKKSKNQFDVASEVINAIKDYQNDRIDKRNIALFITDSIQEYSDQQNADLKKENEELKNIIRVDQASNKLIMAHFDNLKAKADEMYEMLKEYNIQMKKFVDKTPVPKTSFEIIQSIYNKAKQAIENYNK